MVLGWYWAGILWYWADICNVKKINISHLNFWKLKSVSPHFSASEFANTGYSA